MNCIKTINIQHEYGTTRLALLSSITFFLVFCFSYVLTSLGYDGWHADHYILLFIVCFFLVYPVHKLIHYVSLFEYKKSLSLRLKFEFSFVPIIKMRLQDTIPKKRYIFSLISPFLILNTLFLFGSFWLPAYAHYFCLLLGFHCAICVLDILSIKNIWHAPKHAVIEETPKGYEILIPQ